MRLALFELLVDGLLVGNLLEKFLDGILLNLELTFLIGSVGPLLVRQTVLFHTHYKVVLAFRVVQVMLQLVDLVKKLNILLHEALIDLLVTLISLGQCISQVVYV